jgi:biotin carboxylase
MTTATYRASAFLEAARRLDMPVVVGSDREQALSAANPAGHLTLDFLAPEKATGAIVEFAKHYPIRAVVAADDDGAILAAMVAAALGLPHSGVDAVVAARDKHRMREVLAAAGVPSPRSELVSIDEEPHDVARRVVFPCVVKPLFLSASRGVIRADDPAQFAGAFRRLTAILRRPEVAAEGGALAQQVLVETFIPGIEVALEGLLSEGKLRVLALFDKPDPLEGPFFEETIYVTPSRLPAPLQQAIVACTEDAVTALGLQRGPVHAELRLNDQGPWILEIAPRSIGGLCSRALRFGEGISLEELILRDAMGLEVASLQRADAFRESMRSESPSRWGRRSFRYRRGRGTSGSSLLVTRPRTASKRHCGKRIGNLPFTLHPPPIAWKGLAGPHENLPFDNGRR